MLSPDRHIQPTSEDASSAAQLRGLNVPSFRRITANSDPSTKKKGSSGSGGYLSQLPRALTPTRQLD